MRLLLGGPALSRKSVALCLASWVLHVPHLRSAAFPLSGPGLNSKGFSMSSTLTIRQDATRIFQAAVAAVNPELLAESSIEVVGDGSRIRVAGKEISAANGIHLIAFGKASLKMTRGAERKLGPSLKSGIVICQPGDEAEVAQQQGFKSEIMTGAAGNLPDEGAMAGAKRAMQIATQAGEGESIIVLVSGGGSALLTLPAEGVSLADKLATTKALVRAGASIDQLNTVRKHLSQCKGGQLAAAAHPAAAAGLVLSDVVGDPLDVIASGPTVPDSSSHADALAVLESLNSLAAVPAAVLARLRSGAQRADGVSETPKEGDPRLQRTHTAIVGSNRIAADSAIVEAAALGYQTDIATLQLQGDTAAAARSVADTVRAHLQQSAAGNPPLRDAQHGRYNRCVIFGGETTVVLPDLKEGVLPGKGGRATHLALLVARELAGVEGWSMLCGATDGQDGPTDAAGAIVDGGTLRRGRERGTDAEEAAQRCDSYRFFEAEGGLYKTGLTGTNVMDIHVLLLSAPT